MACDEWEEQGDEEVEEKVVLYSVTRSTKYDINRHFFNVHGSVTDKLGCSNTCPNNNNRLSMGVHTFKKDVDFNVCLCSSHIFIIEQYMSLGKRPKNS